MRTTYSQDRFHNIYTLTCTIGDKHSLLILYELTFFGDKSFNELKRMTLTNAVTLTKRLHTLRDAGYIDCRKAGKENHYHITRRADTIKPILQCLHDLGYKDTHSPA